MTAIMAQIAQYASWKVEKAELDYIQRDGIILLQNTHQLNVEHSKQQNDKACS